MGQRARTAKANRTRMVFYLSVGVIVFVFFSICNIVFDVEEEGRKELNSSVMQIPSKSRSKSNRAFDAFGVPPEGSPPNLPSHEGEEGETRAESVRSRLGYGGAGEKKHLGGFTELDTEGISPHLWKYMMSYFGIKSIVDVGCGRGISTSWFYLQGIQTQCVEGSKDAIKRNIFRKLVAKDGLDPNKMVVEHDFTNGPWWPAQTVDAIWSIEFLEHMSRPYQKNYIATFKKAALVFVSHSVFGGWHHTEVHSTEYWIERFEMQGFKYSKSMSNKAHTIIANEAFTNIPFPTGGKYNGQRMRNNFMVFINPPVASLPEHAHLLAEPGCYNELGKASGNTAIQCGEEINPNGRAVSTPLPDHYKPIPYKEEKHLEWEALIVANVEQSKKSK
jgi:2-polyprenyl-3-methyl-5-hydroxy-6-metoxy-1,4-benzoquinol methylase